jgi:aryl-alcohol dehydrogenase-like predicted oxidoreductase
LGLGTVQFGIPYGVTNERGQVTEGDAAAIVGAALSAGINTFDTAAAYGDSENVLGQALASRADVQVVSKLPPLKCERIGAEEIARCRATFARSLRRLRRSSLHGLLLHDAEDLGRPGGERLAAFLEDLKRAGEVAKVGVSVYRRSLLESALARMPLDLVQLPINVLDQRALKDGTLALLKARGVEVHARSVFLQGALLADPMRLPSHFADHRGALSAVAGAAARSGLSPLALCLRFVLERTGAHRAIVGVTTLAELREIIAAAGDSTPLPDDLEFLACDDVRLIDPSLWPARPAS